MKHCPLFWYLKKTDFVTEHCLREKLAAFLNRRVDAANERIVGTLKIITYIVASNVKIKININDFVSKHYFTVELALLPIRRLDAFNDHIVETTWDNYLS